MPCPVQYGEWNYGAESPPLRSAMYFLMARTKPHPQGKASGMRFFFSIFRFYGSSGSVGSEEGSGSVGSVVGSVGGSVG